MFEESPRPGSRMASGRRRKQAPLGALTGLGLAVMLSACSFAPTLPDGLGTPGVGPFVPVPSPSQPITPSQPPTPPPVASSPRPFPTLPPGWFPKPTPTASAPPTASPTPEASASPRVPDDDDDDRKGKRPRRN